MSELERLNAFLQNKKLDIPSNRRVVDKHGANLAWLRKHLHVRNEVPEDISALLSKDIGQLNR
tara:strand:+ start:177 stop:365 length:189 start_codon:yes stop_codon:yes gene_type:complete